MGRRPTSNLLNRAEFGCSEENESWSGVYPELIYSVMHMHASTHELACTHGRCSVMGMPKPEPPAGARMIGA